MNTLQCCIIYYTVAVSIDRFLHVSMGLNTNHYCTARNSILVIILITIAACIFIGPHWLQYHVVKQMTEDNRTVYQMHCKYLIRHRVPSLFDVRLSPYLRSYKDGSTEPFPTDR